jgi:RNA polymerase sigma-70 factor (ECF subfamily)
MDETKIISAVLAGDDEAYGRLIERYQAGLVRYCLTITRDEDAAEDIAQEAFIRAYDKLDRYDARFKFSTWLYKIAHNLALKSLRRPPDLPFDEELGVAAEDRAAEADAVEEREAAVRRAVAGLSVNYQTVIHLHYWERREYAEIAEIMGVPATTVKTWLYRARQALKDRLGEVVGFDPDSDPDPGPDIGT